MTDTTQRKKILWIKLDPLHPVDTGGRIRTYNMVKELSQRHDVYYVAVFPRHHDPEAKRLAGEYSKEQVWIDFIDPKQNKFAYLIDLLKNLFLSTQPYVVYKYVSPEFKQAIKNLCEQHNFDLIISDFLQSTANLIDAAEEMPQIKNLNTVLFQHNVEAIIWRRHYENETRPLLKQYYKLQWKRCENYEIEASKWFKGVIAVSPDDCRSFEEEMGLTNILGHVKTGVNIDFFKTDARKPEPGHIVFLGAMDWMANIEGICRFVADSYPQIKAKIPDARLTIVGRNPDGKVKQLAANDSSITVTGTVDDVRPYLASAQLAIVPLNIGGGTRLKIFELMAANLPVVSTSIGAEGLPVTHDENILLADDPTSFANSVIDLLSNPSRCDELAESAFRLVQENFSWSKVVDEFEAMLLDSQAQTNITNKAG